MRTLNSSLDLIHDGPLYCDRPVSQRQNFRRRFWRISLLRIAAITLSIRRHSARCCSVVGSVMADIVRCESGSVPRECRGENSRESHKSAQEWAAFLNGRQYREELTAAEEAQAKADGVLIIFGASDDLMELRGIISDEVSSYEGGQFILTAQRCIESEHRCHCKFCAFESLKAKADTVEAKWHDRGDYSWTYESRVTHWSFDVLEGDSRYCQGIVIHRSELYDEEAR